MEYLQIQTHNINSELYGNTLHNKLQIKICLEAQFLCCPTPTALVMNMTYKNSPKGKDIASIFRVGHIPYRKLKFMESKERALAHLSKYNDVC